MEVSARRSRVGYEINEVDVLLFISFIVYGLYSQFFMLSIIGGAVLVFIMKALWRPFVPPVLMVALILHWTQVFASIVFADFNGVTMDELYNSRGTEFLYTMTFIQLGIIAIALNFFVYDKRVVSGSLETIKQAAKKINVRNVVIGYLITIVVTPMLMFAAHTSAALSQLVISFGMVKIFFNAMLFFVLMLNKSKNNSLIIALLVFDFILSLAAFFSDFRFLFVMMIIVYFTINPKLKLKSVLFVVPVAISLLFMLSVWSYVKGDYRAYLNQGERKQNVSVSKDDALNFISDKIFKMGGEELNKGATTMLSRLQYMERYSEVYARVPSFIPHAGGKDLSETIQFVFMPRFLNENKGIKDASAKTSYYTGRKFSGVEKGTSISMGYFCDLYIDYGLFVMIIPLIIIFIVFGWLYRWWFSHKSYNVIFLYSFAIGAFLSMGNFESDSLQFLGVLRNNIVFLLIGSVTFIPFMHKLLINK